MDIERNAIITIGGEKYRLILTTRATKQIAQRFGGLENLGEKLMKADGWFINIYTNGDFIKSGKFSATTIKSNDVWLADYSGAPDYPCGIQQTGSTGTLPGITGAVDMDTAFKDYPTIIRAGGYNGFVKPKPINFKCDTTKDITLAPGQAYQFMISSSSAVTVTVGTPRVVTLLPRYHNGGDSFFYIVGFGKSGSSAGVYVNGVKQFVAHMK